MNEEIKGFLEKIRLTINGIDPMYGHDKNITNLKIAMSDLTTAVQLLAEKQDNMVDDSDFTL